MRKILNKFAVWLFHKTKPKKEPDLNAFLGGMKVLISNYIPDNTIMFGKNDHFKMDEIFKFREVKDK